jgi:hypothetical protein
MNGQVEKANGLICNIIKKRLHHSRKLNMLRKMSYPPCYGVCEPLQTQQLKKHLSFLVHGAEVMLPVEITHEAPRISSYKEIASTEA